VIIFVQHHIKGIEFEAIALDKLLIDILLLRKINIYDLQNDYTNDKILSASSCSQ
jgi:hypothetical protein